MKLLFKKNILLKFSRQSGQLCPGEDKCFYPGSVTCNTYNTGFKDEPRIETIKTCLFKQYLGPTTMPSNLITRKQYEEMIRKYTLCWHPEELTMTTEWRCYKCNAVVNSERERHKCY